MEFSRAFSALRWVRGGWHVVGRNAKGHLRAKSARPYSTTLQRRRRPTRPCDVTDIRRPRAPQPASVVARHGEGASIKAAEKNRERDAEQGFAARIVREWSTTLSSVGF